MHVIGNTFYLYLLEMYIRNTHHNKNTQYGTSDMYNLKIQQEYLINHQLILQLIPKKTVKGFM